VNEIITVNNLRKQYVVGEVTIPVLKGINFSLYEGELVVILGPSGSGKSTMMNLLGGLDSPTEGEIIFNNKNIGAASDKELTKYRSNAIGFVFQFYNLLQNLTAKENIDLAATLSNDPIDTDELLEKIGMADHAGHFPAQMSGGQQQRVAIARAIAKNPSLLLCDEPTGALDSSTGVQVIRLLMDFNRTFGKTIVIITHNAVIADIADRVFYVRDGQIEKIEVNENPIKPEEVTW
jgi:putative ABC transport system ATP-binding protein